METQLQKFHYKSSLDEQRALFAECFPETVDLPIIGKSHYSWKFHSFPSEIKSYEFGAFDGEDLIGYYAAIPYQYVVSKKEVSVGMVCDVMTGVKARGKGIFTKMGAYATNVLNEENISFTTGFPIRKEVIPGHLKVGWEIMHSLPLFVKFISFKSLFKSKGIGFLYLIADFIINIYYFILSFSNSKLSYEISDYSNEEIDNINGLNEFLDEWVEQQEIGLKKNSEFLKWRLGAPDKRYTISVARKQTRIVGYAVFCDVVKENIPSTAILDVSTLKGNTGVSTTILRHIGKIAKRNNKESIIMMCSTHLYNIHKMRSSGFIKTPYKFSLIVKNLNNQFSNELFKDEKNWHLTWIDSDNL